jgi:hypothetical protein
MEEGMTDRLHVATRKGLFEVARHNGGWEIADAQFLGDPLSAVLADPGGALYAALDLGHFGAKLWRRDAGSAWRELSVPAFPPKPKDAGDDPILGRSAKSGRSSRAEFSDGYGRARCPAGSSAPMTAANHGR